MLLFFLIIISYDFYVSIAEASDLLESKTWWSEYFILLYFSYNSDSGFWDEYCQLSRKNNTPHHPPAPSPSKTNFQPSEPPCQDCD